MVAMSSFTIKTFSDRYTVTKAELDRAGFDWWFAHWRADLKARDVEILTRPLEPITFDYGRFWNLRCLGRAQK